MNAIQRRGALFYARAMTLIELMVALVIVGILTSFAASYYTNVRNDAARAKVKADLIEIKKALLNFMADEYNTGHKMPENLTSLTDARGVEFKAMAVKDGAGNLIKNYPDSPATVEILLNEYSDKFERIDNGGVKTISDYKTEEVIVTRYFIDKIPQCPWGGSYYADLFNVYAHNKSTGERLKENYRDVSNDKFYGGILTSDFYDIKHSGGAFNPAEGRIEFSAHDFTSNSASSYAFISSKEPVRTIEESRIECFFRYSQKYTELSNYNYSGRLVDEVNDGTEFNRANGLIYFFTAQPAACGEAALPKTGFGIKFSAVAWKIIADGFYVIPSEAVNKKSSVENEDDKKYYMDNSSGLYVFNNHLNQKETLKEYIGGWEPSARHAVKFVFKSSSRIDCYIDGDLKASVYYAQNVKKNYFVIAADFFTSNELPAFADSIIELNSIYINSVDFSKYYTDKKYIIY